MILLFLNTTPIATKWLKKRMSPIAMSSPNQEDNPYTRLERNTDQVINFLSK